MILKKKNIFTHTIALDGSILWLVAWSWNKWIMKSKMCASIIAPILNWLYVPRCWTQFNFQRPKLTHNISASFELISWCFAWLDVNDIYRSVSASILIIFRTNDYGAMIGNTILSRLYYFYFSLTKIWSTHSIILVHFAHFLCVPTHFRFVFRFYQTSNWFLSSKFTCAIFSIFPLTSIFIFLVIFA